MSVPDQQERKAARPADYAKWGAELGLATALNLRRQNIEGAARRRALFCTRQVAFETACRFQRLGASADEARLYRHAFEQALTAQLAARPGEIIAIRIV